MDRSPSAHPPEARDPRPSFRKPANEASRRNYRRRSPSSSQSRSPSPGGWKRDRSPSCQDNGGSKKGRSIDDSGKGREDTRFRRTTDGPWSHGHYQRDRHGRSEDYHNRRPSCHHDRSYQASLHARSKYSSFDDGRYARRSSEKSTRERIADDVVYRRRENRDKDERGNDAKAADRDRVREEADARDGYKSKVREAHRGQERCADKYRDDGSDVEAEEARQGKRSDSEARPKDANGVEARDRYLDVVESRVGRKSRVELEKSREREGRRREREDRNESENAKGDFRNRDKGQKGHDERRRRPLPSSDAKGYSSDEPDSTEDLSRERAYGQGHSRKGEKEKRYSGESGRSKFSNMESAGGVQEAAAHMDETKNLDDKTSKGSKWGPEADYSDANTGSSDHEAAMLAAMKAAALVNINLGGIKSVDEKKKMLWGSKEQKPAAASGTNRWETVCFADRERQEKFHKLMGVKGEAGAAGGEGNTSTLFTTEKQEELQHDLEKQFTAGLRRRDGRTVGLGL